MNTKYNKEQLTAYVLGELDEQARADVEQALAADKTVREQVEEIRAAAEITRELFAGAPELTLSDNQRETITSQAAGAEEDEGAEVVPLKARSGSRWLAWPVLRAAAVFLVVIGAGAVVFYPQLDSWRDGIPLSEEISPQAVGHRFIERSAKKSRPDPKSAYYKKALGNARGDRQDTPASTNEPRDKQQDPSATGGQQTQPMDQETFDQLSALGYIGGDADSDGTMGEVSVIAEVPAYEAEINHQNAEIHRKNREARSYNQSLVDEYGGPPPSVPQAMSAGAAAPVTEGRSSGMTSALEKREAEEDAYDDANLNHWPGHNTEAYDRIEDNPFKAVGENPLSTFSIDVDTAAYANMRRFINQNQRPPKDSVRIEELVNYFSYDYEPPRGDTPFSANVAVAGCPWNADHRLARVGLKGWEMANDRRPSSNLVFLLDVSGSMRSQNKLPLLKEAMGLLVEQLGEKDSVAIAVYAGASGLVLPPTTGDNKQVILGALDNLQAGGSTNGGAGIELAYDLAVRNFIRGGVNRVILATDGDFNVGTTSRGDLTRVIEDKAKSGVFLTVLGFGMGNLKDATMENLADKGNGNYAYIDTIREAKKVLVDEIGSTMVTIAKDVKIQVEFNPAEVSAYRLIGYENRILAAEDFNDDTKDAGEIGAGHTVTALYELVPAGVESELPGVDPLKYQQTTTPSREAGSGELFTIKLRYKKPDGDKSSLLSFPVTDTGTSYARATPDFKFAAAVASFGMILRDSPHKGSATFGSVIELAEEGLGRDAHGYRAEFIELVRRAESLNR